MRFLLKLRLPVRMMVFQCVTELYNKLFSINLDMYVAFFSLALKWTWLVNVVSNVSYMRYISRTSKMRNMKHFSIKMSTKYQDISYILFGFVN